MNAIISRIAKLERAAGACEKLYDHVFLWPSRHGHQAEDEAACCAALGVEPGPKVLVLLLVGQPAGA